MSFQNLAPIFPTTQLDCKQLSLIFGCVLVGMAAVASSRDEEQATELHTQKCSFFSNNLFRHMQQIFKVLTWQWKWFQYHHGQELWHVARRTERNGLTNWHRHPFSDAWKTKFIVFKCQGVFVCDFQAEHSVCLYVQRSLRRTLCVLLQRWLVRLSL